MEIKYCVNLDACIQFLAEQSGFKEWLKESEEDAIVMYHHTIGRYLRNNLKLWDSESVMSSYFNSIGIYHPDDMSSIILRSAYRKYNGKDIKLMEQIDHYIQFWDRENPNINKGIFNK